MTFLMFAAGLVALVLGASWLVRGASSMAASFGISPLIIGLTVVALGTSAPEIAVSVSAVLEGTSNLAIGNVVGSNIFNVLFILGASALITPLVVNRQLIRQEVPIMVAASALLVVLCLDGVLSFADGLLLTALLVAYTVLLIAQSQRARRVYLENTPTTAEASAPATRSWADTWMGQIALILVGLGALVLGSEWLVSSSVSFAKALGVSDTVIGLTIVAAGTSLPEVAASIAAAIKGERDMAVGNVVGSNIFNILGCLGIASVVSGSTGLTIAESVQAFDIWVMLAVMLACVPVFMSCREISRWEGVYFLGYYAAYTTYLVLAAQHSSFLVKYTETLTTIVIPASLMTFVLITYAQARARRHNRVR